MRWGLVVVVLLVVFICVVSIILLTTCKRKRKKHQKKVKPDEYHSSEPVQAETKNVDLAAAIRKSLLRSKTKADEAPEAEPDGFKGWFKGAKSAVGDYLIDLKKKDYRRQARLTLVTAQVGDHQVSYLDRQKGDQAILMLHGFAGEKDLFVWFASEIGDAYRVIVPDLPGFGESSRLPSSEYDILTQAERVVAFLDVLKLKKVHVVGNSMGGNIAARLSRNHPDRVISLTLMDALGVGSPVMSEVGNQILRDGTNPLLITSKEEFQRFVKLVFVNPPPLPSFVLDYFAEKMIEHKEFNRKIMMEMATKPDDLTPADLKQINIPTLILWGDKDRVIDVSAARVFETNIPGAKLSILKDTGHAPMAEKPKLTAQLLHSFLSSIKPP